MNEDTPRRDDADEPIEGAEETASPEVVAETDPVETVNPDTDITGAMSAEARKAEREERRAAGESRTGQFFRELTTGSAMVSVLAIVIALVVGGILIAISSPRVHETAEYFFSRPQDTLYASFDAVYGAYQALFRGAVFDWRAEGIADSLKPLTDSLFFATPLILAGLGLAITFRAGLFNIGGQGQIILGAMSAGYIGFAFDLPVALHLLLAIFAGVLGGALWAFIPGILKAKTGANEVIVTIMLNNIAVYFIGYVLSQDAFQSSGSNQPISPTMADTAVYPQLLGPNFRLHAGFLVAIAATAFAWWLLERSTTGFELRAVGANQNAARTGGVSVNRTIVTAMVVSGILCGLAGTSAILEYDRSLTAGVAANYGFDAITVALLGRSRPWATFWAGILFGALKSGGFLMQATARTPLEGAAANVPIDIILVVQSVIVLLIAAPPLVRAIFRVPDPNSPRRKPRPVAAKGAVA